jgi:hypothetical protein
MKRLILVLVGLAAAAPAFAQDSTGAWQLSVTTSQGTTRTASMSLKKEGDKLTGTLVTPQNAEIPVTGTQTGADVAVAFTVQSQNGPVPVALKGRQDGESMKGTVDIGNGADRGDWTATRGAAPAAAAASGSSDDLTGTWALQITTPNGPGAPTATIKQEGEKLTGRYKGMFGESPLTGQVKGKAFTFDATFTIEGNAVTITYTGAVDQDGMSGKVKFGDFAEGTFTGKKQ